MYKKCATLLLKGDPLNLFLCPHAMPCEVILGEDHRQMYYQEPVLFSTRHRHLSFGHVQTGYKTLGQ